MVLIIALPVKRMAGGTRTGAKKAPLAQL